MKKLALALAAILIAPAANASNLVQNGGFETSSYAGASEIGAGYGGGQSYGQGVAFWTASNFTSLRQYAGATTTMAPNQWNDPLDILAATFTPLAGGGNNFIGLDADPTYGGPISQTINGLTAGSSYVVNFSWGATQLQNRTGGTHEQVHVGLGGAPTQATADVNIGSQGFSGWMNEAFTFTADGPSDVLSFFGSGGPSGQPPYITLDNVSLNAAVPEPATWAMMLLGVAGLGAAARTRRRSTAAATRATA